MNTYIRGTSVKVFAAPFKDLAGAAFDPSPVICIVKTPDGVETSYTYGIDAALVKDSTGNYHLWIETTQAGVYGYRFKGGGAVNVANEGTFFVTESEFSAP